MNWVKIAPLLFLALAIDGFQFLVSLALSVVAAAPGTALGAAGGAAAGAYLCQGFGSVIIAGCSATGGIVLGLFGTWFDGAAVITEPIGIALGFAVSICISFTLGSVLVLFLQVLGVLDKKAATAAYIGEVLPGLSALPAWTALVVRCAMKEAKKEVLGGVLGGVAGIGGVLTLPNTAVENAARAGTRTPARNDREDINQSTDQNERSPETSTQKIPMQDMRLRSARPADNNPQPQPSYAKAA